MASIAGTEPLEVSGVVVPALHRVPVALGDDVVTRNNTAILHFRDGSEILLQPNSKVRIEDSHGAVAAHMVSGSATYKIVPRSTLKVIDSSDSVVNAMLNHVSAEMNTAVASTKLAQNAVTYRASAANTVGMVLPASAISSGNFTTASKSALGTPNGGSRIVTPSGVQYEVTAVNGQLVITNVLVPVSGPTGPVQYLQVDSFKGATISVTTLATAGKYGLVITMPGQTVPLTPEQAQAALQTGTAASFINSLNTGQLTQNVLAPFPQPVNAGSFTQLSPNSP